MRTSQTKIINLFRVYATFSVAFLLSYCISGVVSPISNSSAVTCENDMISGTDDVCGTDTTDVNVSIEGAWTVSISSDSNLNVNLTPTSSGVVNTATDNVNIYTNAPNGYQLYLNSTTGSTDIYNNNVLDSNGNLDPNLPLGTNTNHFIATTGTKTTPVTLTSNTWGYSLSTNPTTFSKVETSSSAVDALISTGSKTSGSGDNLDVTYGFNADTKLTPGTYTTSVTYTAVAEVPSYNITSISPNELHINDQTDKQITIMTSTPSSELELGNITAKIGTIDLTNCSETIVNGYRGATCTYNGNLPVDTYNVQLTSSWHSATYTLTNEFIVYQTTMQNFTSTNCTSLQESTTTIDNRTYLKDSRDGKIYGVSKLADGNCWMVQNLALDGGRTLYPSDSNVTANRVLPSTANLPFGSTVESVYNDPQIYTGHANTTDEYGNKYGNLYNWNAATATVGLEMTYGTVKESVCAKGWLLSDKTGSKSYDTLIASQGITQDSAPTLQMAPTRFPMSNQYVSGYGLGYGRYWTNTTNESQQYAYHAYEFAFTPTGFDTTDLRSKLRGYAVRCVFGG